MVEHLRKGNISYGRHCVDAIIGGGHLILTGIVSVIHGLFPFLFEKYVAKTMITYYWRHFHYHDNPDFQKLIQNEKDFADRRQKVLYGIDKNDDVLDFEEMIEIVSTKNKENKNV